MFPTACLALFLMLSGVGFLERLGCSICCADVKIGSLKCNILIFFVLLSSIGFCTSLYGVEKYERLRDQGTDHVSLDDRYTPLLKYILYKKIVPTRYWVR